MIKTIINITFKAIKIILIAAGIIYFINYFSIKSFNDNNPKTIASTIIIDMISDSHINSIIKIDSLNVNNILPI